MTLRSGLERKSIPVAVVPEQPLQYAVYAVAVTVISRPEDGGADTTIGADTGFSETDFTRSVNDLSGGQKTRINLGKLLLQAPQLLILDEPTSGLDVDSRRSFWKIMADQAARGRTIIFATHYIEEADDFAQRVILLSRGRIVADGPIETIRESVSGSVVSCSVGALPPCSSKR